MITYAYSTADRTLRKILQDIPNTLLSGDLQYCFYGSLPHSIINSQREVFLEVYLKSIAKNRNSTYTTDLQIGIRLFSDFLLSEKSIFTRLKTKNFSVFTNSRKKEINAILFGKELSILSNKELSILSNKELSILSNKDNNINFISLSLIPTSKFIVSCFLDNQWKATIKMSAAHINLIHTIDLSGLDSQFACFYSKDNLSLGAEKNYFQRDNNINIFVCIPLKRFNKIFVSLIFKSEIFLKENTLCFLNFQVENLQFLIMFNKNEFCLLSVSINNQSLKKISDKNKCIFENFQSKKIKQQEIQYA